ncbi:pilus assembly protein [Dyella jejuensis]|uniref:Pilus assembly protein n=1 Tax=Dyella jejuensis TaxID=1432009 RepID=A0ABW8JD60_9GAMM
MHSYRNMPRAHRNATRHNQQGFALLVALIFLLLMTMLAVAASEHSLLQERMAGSLRNAQQARMSAETALRGAEYKLWSIASRAGATLHCQQDRLSQDDGCVIYRPLGTPYGDHGEVTQFRSAPGWISGMGVPYTGPAHAGYTGQVSQPTAALAENPRYIIEDLGSERPPLAGSLHESGNTGPNNRGQGEADIHVYRITARATGGNPNVVSVMQSTFDAPASR